VVQAEVRAVKIGILLNGTHHDVDVRAMVMAIFLCIPEVQRAKVLEKAKQLDAAALVGPQKGIIIPPVKLS
jgi:hypothetical protein